MCGAFISVVLHMMSKPSPETTAIAMGTVDPHGFSPGRREADAGAMFVLESRGDFAFPVLSLFFLRSGTSALFCGKKEQNRHIMHPAMPPVAVFRWEVFLLVIG